MEKSPAGFRANGTPKGVVPYGLAVSGVNIGGRDGFGRRATGTSSTICGDKYSLLFLAFSVR
jgi:hypothetical protein